MEKKQKRNYGNVGQGIRGCCNEENGIAYMWNSQYENGYKSVMDEQRSRRLTSITSQKVQEIKELLDKDRCITVREVTQWVDCSAGTVHTIIHDNLNMRRLCARYIP